MTDAPADGNGRITWRDIYKELEKHAEARENMELRLSTKIDSLRDCMPSAEKLDRAYKRADDAHTRLDGLQKEDRIWNGLNSIGVIIAGALATLFGAKQ